MTDKSRRARKGRVELQRSLVLVTVIVFVLAAATRAFPPDFVWDSKRDFALAGLINTALAVGPRNLSSSEYYRVDSFPTRTAQRKVGSVDKASRTG